MFFKKKALKDDFNSLRKNYHDLLTEHTSLSDSFKELQKEFELLKRLLDFKYGGLTDNAKFDPNFNAHVSFWVLNINGKSEEYTHTPKEKAVSINPKPRACFVDPQEVNSKNYGLVPLKKK